MTQKLLEGIRKLMSGETVAVGIGSAGFIDPLEGKVVFSGNIQGWTGYALVEALEREIPLPVYLENDANIAALCEAWVGAAKGFRSFVMLTLGTGLGGAIYHEDYGLWQGMNAQGAELGHMILHPGGRPCTCGQRGCAETYAAGSALAKNYYDLTGERLEGPEIMALLPDPLAREALHRMMDDLATLLATLKNIFDPEAILLGGGFIASKEHWWDELLQKFEKTVNRSEGCILLPAAYGNEAGVIGAAGYALRQKSLS